jgi:hypothetical protein
MLYWEKLLFVLGYIQNVCKHCGQNVDCGLERCFLTFVPWRNSENNFECSEEPLVVKMFPGQKKLIQGSAIQLLLNYDQENVYVKKIETF